MRVFLNLSASRRSAASLPLVLLTCLAFCLTLGACTPDPEEKAPQCPIALLRPDASTLNRYDGHGTDLTNLVLSGRLLNINGRCEGLLGKNTLKARAQAEMVLTRGPAAIGREVDVPYIIAVTRNDQPNNPVLDHREYTQHVVFPPNVDTVRVTGSEVWFNFPTRRGLGGQNYTIYLLFALSPEELAANQKALGIK
jgi:hypothetical protein